jgi:transcriptional regulator with XRE-family HTH domain
MDDSLGARLRYERERRQIALRSISESTKIGFPLLEGLERNDVSRWPSGIFRKSFLRLYVEAIGLDPEPIVREFVELYPDPLEAVPAVPEAPPRKMALLRTVRLLPVFKHKLPRLGGRARQLMDAPPVVVKLTVSEAGTAFTKEKLLRDIRKRWAAVACDAGVSCGMALCMFTVLGHFWTPLSVSMLCYYGGGIVLLGNTPGVCLFAPGQTDKSPAAPKG